MELNKPIAQHLYKSIRSLPHLMPKLSWMTGSDARTAKEREETTEFHSALRAEARQRILKLIYKKPMTSAQIASVLGLSRSVVGNHMDILQEAGIVRRVEIPREEKEYVKEKYYTVAFPIIFESDRKKLDEMAKAIGNQVSSILKEEIPRAREVYRSTKVASLGWDFEKVYPYVESRIRYFSSYDLESALGRRPVWIIGFELTEEEVNQYSRMTADGNAE